jgi:hypothetical protein
VARGTTLVRSKRLNVSRSAATITGGIASGNPVAGEMASVPSASAVEAAPVIGKISDPRGEQVAGLIYYLFGPGRCFRRAIPPPWAPGRATGRFREIASYSEAVGREGLS